MSNVSRPLTPFAMVHVLLAVGVALLALSAHGAESIPCEWSTPSEANRCASAQLERDERALNEAYVALRARLRTSDDKSLEESLVRAQRIWVKYREAHCEFDADVQVVGNPWNSYHRAVCLSGEAQARTEYLKRVAP
jgi:uncharacterized protein YecT (DUF1311 family)